MKRFLLFVLVIAIFLACLYAWTRHRNEARQPAPYTPPVAPVVDAQDVHVLATIDQEYTRLVDAVLPSVVSIITSKQVQTGYIIDLNEVLRSGQLRGVPKLESRSVLGSGVIVSKEGHIITNYHVIADMDKIQVELNDGRVEPAEIIGTDPDTDIAVLKINAGDVRPLPLGNSDDVKVGQLVFAVGNPLGLQETVTRGIISAKSRVVDDSSFEYFQTDAAINEGNSGGPLLDLRGEIIGINTRVASQMGKLQPQGLSFAIPSNVARRTLEAILKDGHVVHSYLGVVYPSEHAGQPGGYHGNGVFVTRVLPGSPAEKAGLKSGDVITEFNGREIAGVHDLHNCVAETPVNTDVTLGIVHAGGQTATLTTQIIARPADFGAMQSASANILSGIKVAEIPDDKRPDLPENVKGVMVVDIDPASMIGTLLAKKPGTLKPGDVIEYIDRLPVASVADFKQIAGQFPPGPQQTRIIYCRGKEQLYIVATTP